MPNRILKESICTSPNLDLLSPAAEAFFYRLVVQCDDHGRLDARSSILRARCYPLRLDTMTNAVIEQLLAELLAANLVSTYVVAGLPYLAMTTWSKHQHIRAQQSKYPAPPPDLPPAQPWPAPANSCQQLQTAASSCLQLQADAGSCQQLQADASSCQQLRADASSCQQLQADVPVIRSDPIRSESEAEAKITAPDGAHPTPLPAGESPATAAPTAATGRSMDNPSAQQAIFGALATVCVLDPKLKAAQIGKTAKQLVTAGYDAGQITAFGEWFKTVDWRGQRGSPPTLAQVVELIKQSVTPRTGERNQRNDNHGDNHKDPHRYAARGYDFGDDVILVAGQPTGPSQ